MVDKCKAIWDEQWLRQSRTAILERVASLFRRTVISRFVSHYMDKYFKAGVYVELGCGTGETSSRINRERFTCIGLDVSSVVLKRARQQSAYDHYVVGNILKLPLADESIDGVWNVGVMEHFSREELSHVFREFNRVLKPAGCVVLFWPWVLAPSHVIFHSYESIIGKFGLHKQIFPPAPSMLNLRSLSLYREVISSSGFTGVRFHFPWMDLSHWAVVAFKR